MSMEGLDSPQSSCLSNYKKCLGEAGPRPDACAGAEGPRGSSLPHARCAHPLAPPPVTIKGKRAARWPSSVRRIGSVSIACTVRSLVRLPQAAKTVMQIESKYAFQEALNSAGEKLVVVDFSATWCGPCKMIKPFFHSLSEKYSNVVFLEVDVDDCQDVTAECEVKCMPTFQFFKKGQKVGEFSGANKEKLEATINELI
ncbi:thioredoxin-like [Moschus berezovskii]|uniref:thioredoxin-like n=1 Tax=Moschus berezovskii TaxID=68408 RepID=UPI0024440DFA|nr:thioredoxin-like [Moschus berezovskii]